MWVTGGNINREFTVWCGGEDCVTSERVHQNNMSEAIASLRRLGWGKGKIPDSSVKKAVWLCPKCYGGPNV